MYRGANRHMKIVSFSGIDGAGKSTQIDALRTFLKERGLRSNLYTFWDNIVALRNLREAISYNVFKGDRGVGSPGDPIQRRDKNITSWYVTSLRFFLYLLDAVRLRLAVARIKGNTNVAIFDRYIYDELANLPLHHWAVKVYVRSLLSLVRKPDLALLIDAKPEAASARKPEYPLEFVHRNREAYFEISRLAGMTILPPCTVEETAQTIRNLIDENCWRESGNAPEVDLRSPGIPSTSVR
jgi:thymidylate kinase